MDKNLLQTAKAPMIALIQTKNIIRTNLRTKTKRTFALLLLLILLVPFAAWAQTYSKFYEFDSDSNGSINKSEMGVFCQDTIFRNIIFDIVDADKNGGMSLEEVVAYSCKGMDCNNWGITSLAGIELFEGLMIINCSNNSLTEIDLSYNIFVSQLECYGNQISGDKMDALIASLPQATDGIFIVIDLQNPNEQNICTTTQVAAALARGWVVYAVSGEETTPYDGEGAFGGGSGTEDDPYIIATTDDMDALAALVNGGNDQSGVYFLQTDTLDYRNKTYTPVGNNTNFFQGNYNGQGNIITGVYINTEYAGLFGWVGANGVVRNLTLGGGVSWCDIRGIYVGGIAAVNQGEIVGCSVLSSFLGLETDEGIWIFKEYVYIMGNRISGGVVGDNRGNVYDAECNAIIECWDDSNCFTGGLVGTNDGQVNGIFGGVIYNFMIISEGVVGGLVGTQYNGTLSGINRGYFNGDDWNPNFIRNSNQFGVKWTGGIVGSQIAGTVENCLYVSNKWNKFRGSTKAGAIISSHSHGDGVLNNNYYVGECEINGMYNSTSGSVDVAGQAMRGYTITVESPLVVSLSEGATIGLEYEGVIYAGNEQNVSVSFEILNSSITPQCLTLSAGTLTDNTDGTYTITMPEEDITVSGNIVKQDEMFYEIPCEGGTTATLIHDDSYATLDWASIEDFVHNGAQYAVTAIADSAFDGCTDLEGFSIHAPQFATIGANAFRNCTNIISIGFFMTSTPPTVGEGAFENVLMDSIMLGVPYCSQYDFSQHEVFGQCGEIQGYDGCEYNFWNQNGSGDGLWSNPDNWMDANQEVCTEAPGEDAQVAIFTECEVDVDVTVGSITAGSLNEVAPLTVKAGKTLTLTDYIYTANNPENLIIEDGAQVVHPNTGAKATVQKNITAYSTLNNVNNGWHLIGYSFADNGAVNEMDNLLTNNYDLYFYDEPTHYWRNYKPGNQNSGFDLEANKGYLYANSQDVTLGLKGTLEAGNATVNVPLDYSAMAGNLKGFNLVGNPFAHNVTSFAGTNVAEEVYRMNDTKDDLMASTIGDANPLLPGEGFFVKATATDASITFNSRATNAERSLSLSKGRITLDLSESGKLIDRFILKNGGNPLEKLTLNEYGTRLYATQDEQDYAVAVIGGRDGAVCRDGVCCRDAACHVSTDEMPVNFQAAKDGTYTLTFNLENMDLDYLHLIDNLTGADVDLLAAEPVEAASYTFTAKTMDYASRFRLVFSEPADGPSANQPFAYIANGEIIINDADTRGASLQVVDVMGRIVVSRDAARHVSTNGLTAGVYILRLVNGDSVRTQKIIVE